MSKQNARMFGLRHDSLLSSVDDRHSRRLAEQAPVRHDITPRTSRKPVAPSGRYGVSAREKELPPMPSAAVEQQQNASTPPTTKACSPRSSPPSKLTLHSSNGFTALPSPDLKQRICDTRANSTATLIQVPLDSREPISPTPTTPWTMGNKPSSIGGGSPTPDDESNHSVIRTHTRRGSKQHVSRKGSFGNVFKRIDSKSPLPRDVTNSVMSILHPSGTHKKTDSCALEDDAADESAPANPFLDQPEHHDTRYPDSSKVNSTSTTTMTESKAELPLSAGTTIRHHRSEDRLHSSRSQLDGADDTKDLPPLPPSEDEVLSPTLPAPSPLPEDSPHKYGLRDKIDTPEPPKEAVQELSVAKMRRKSSGLEIFNEAKSLQSAQSFLNGLSTARRRAESQIEMRTTDMTDSAYTTTTSGTTRPASSHPSSSHARSKYKDSDGRREGKQIKSSGFAYCRPLTLAQTKCWRGHNKLLPSRNKHAPVECAVCHIDHDGDHFSCSWCAIRMCIYCRKDFAARGMVALKERIRKAELGDAEDSATSSSESLPVLMVTPSTSFE